MATPFTFPRSAPEAQGIASSAILGFVEAVEANIDVLHSFMLVRHGQVVAEGWWAPYASDLPHMLFSLSKSYTSTGVGLAVAEGYFSIDDPVISFFPDETPKRVGKNLAAMQVRHLLTMSTGQSEEGLSRTARRRDGNWVRGFLGKSVKYRPGTRFLYNSGATYMLSAIIQKTTGQTLLEYLTPRLFEPLGIEGATWETCPRGINTGGWGLTVKTEDIARLGQLYLQRGSWQGRQLLPEAWVAEASRKQIDNGDDPSSDWAQGYGYQFWRCRHNLYRGDGAFGQYCIVMPEQDAVLAITSGVDNMQAVMNQAWDHLLPALGDGTLPADAAGEAALRAKLASLVLPAQTGEAASPVAADVNGATYAFEAGNPLGLESATFEFGDDGSATVTFRNGQGEVRTPAGYGTWAAGLFMGERGEPVKSASTGAWTSEDTYTVTAYQVETPFRVTVNCRFAGDELTLGLRVNVSFGPTELPEVVGRRV